MNRELNLIEKSSSTQNTCEDGLRIFQQDNMIAGKYISIYVCNFCCMVPTYCIVRTYSLDYSVEFQVKVQLQSKLWHKFNSFKIAINLPKIDR